MTERETENNLKVKYFCWTVGVFLVKEIFGCKEAEIMHLSSTRTQSNLKNRNVSESQLGIWFI